MTLLGWMHRKLMQNGTEHAKSPTIKNPSCFSVQTLSEHEQRHHTDPPKRFSHSNNNKSTQKSPNIYESTSQVVVLCHEEPLEPFEFLSIGTFGMELLNTDPPTPTVLPTLTNQRVEITENELNLIINHELEKYLEAEEYHTDNNAYNDTSERSSLESVITLSYKGNEGDDSHEGVAQMEANCPLKNYLFAASVELAEMDEREGKRERTSLGELFKRNNVVRDDDDDDDITRVRKSCEGVEQEVKISRNNVARFMKKVAKKFQSSSSDNDSYSTKKKLYKTLVKMFQKKVYPEEMADKELIKLPKGNKKNNNLDQSGTKKGRKMKLSWAGICKGASPVNGGHWIKTDSDYLVLEL